MEHPEDEFNRYIKHVRAQIPTLKTQVQKTSIFTRFGDLSRMTDCARKLPILTDQNFFYENIPEDGETQSCIVESAHYSGVYEVSDASTRLLSNNISELKVWFEASKEMLFGGRITYLPYLISQYSSTIETRPLKYKVMKGVTDELKPKKLFSAFPDVDVKVSDRAAVPLLNLEIPCLENITPSQLFRLMEDYPDRLLGFRNYLQHNLLAFQSKLGSENFYREVHLLEVDLQDRLAKLKSDFKALRRAALLEVIGANAVTWTLYVFVFLKSPDDLLKIVLPGGIVSAVSAAYAKYLREKVQLEGESLYFLYLVSRKSGKI